MIKWWNLNASGHPESMLRNILNIAKKRRIWGSLLALLVIFAIAFGSLLAWVITGPRSIASLTPYIEAALVPAEGYRVQIENPEILWEGWDNPLGVDIKNISIIDGKDESIAHFPEAMVKINFFKLAFGRVEVKKIELIHPHVKLIQNDDGSFFVSSTDKESTSGNSVATILGLIASDSSNPLNRLRSLIIRHANLSVENKSGIFMQSADASLEIIRKHGKINGTFSMPIAYDGKHSSILAKCNLDKHTKTAEVQVLFEQIHTSAVNKLFPGKQWLEGANLTLSGAIQVTTDLEANIRDAKFAIQSGPGSIKYPAVLDEPLNLEQLRIIGDITDNLSVLSISSGKISLVGSDSKTADLLFKGMVRKEGENYGLAIQAETANIAVNDVHRFWPTVLAPQTRKWVTTHINDGNVVKADVTLNFKPGELKQQDAPEQAITSSITLKGSSVKYLPGHPPATDINGVIKFTGKSMDAEVTSAKYMNSEISKASIRMPDMYQDDVRLYLDMDVKAPAKDVAAFLALPRVEKAATLGVTQDATGEAIGNVKFDFIAFSTANREGEDMNYAVTSTLQGVSQKKFMGSRDIENANMKLSVNNKGVRLIGDATVNTVPMAIDLTSSFEKDHNTDYAIKCAMPIKALSLFNLPTLASSSGSADVAANFHDSDTASTSEAKIDLTKSDLNIPENGFIKKAGEQATLELSTQRLSSGNTMITPLQLKGSNNMAISGTAEIDKATGDFAAVTLSRMHFGSNDLNSLKYKQNKDGITVDAEGNAFDVSPYLNTSKKPSDTHGYNIHIDVGHLVFGDKKEMKHATVNADCPDICHTANVEGALADKNKFTYQIKDGKLTATTANFGELIRVLGILDTVEGGKMSLNGAYNGNRIEGTLDVTSYTLKRAPILTKLVTLASFTGIVDTLSGNGIAFNNLHASYSYRDGIIVLKDAKTHGSALGLTASGTLDTYNGTVDVNGVVIPSYTMNSLIGNVPVIGDLLMGGTGKGILAVNYMLKGNTRDPSISVNPLSAFTPGFLRGIFDVFDKPAPDVDKIVEARKKAEENKTKNVTLPTTKTPEK